MGDGEPTGGRSQQDTQQEHNDGVAAAEIDQTDEQADKHQRKGLRWWGGT
jgi:hypothetical protein